MSQPVKVARIVGSNASGTVFQGVGDKEVETHFTYKVGEGFHVSTYLNLGLGTGNEKTKVPVSLKKDS